MKQHWTLFTLVIVFGLCCCALDPPKEQPPSDTQATARCSTNPGYTWDLPKGFPRPCVPIDNPMTHEKVALGRHLFYDKRLSGNQTQSCSSCHLQKLAFTDGKAISKGSTGDSTLRNSMSLHNIVYASTLTWANPLLTNLEMQINVPLFGTRPVELGMRGREKELVQRLQDHSKYQELFKKAYPKAAESITVHNMKLALASFLRSLISGNSVYDQVVYQGKRELLSDSARRGMNLFRSERMECFHCHGGFNFQDSIVYDGKAAERFFHNTALYNIDGKGGYPSPNTGVYEVTEDPKDMGRFRVPTLRNVEVTGPYMHDGSIKTLSEVIDHYAAAGRTISSGPNKGIGKNNPNKSIFMVGFTITDQEKADLIAFLKTLTDKKFLTDPKFSNPWKD
ncbi:MAG: MbnH family di-heme enzyme [Myxococcota bacterium]